MKKNTRSERGAKWRATPGMVICAGAVTGLWIALIVKAAGHCTPEKWGAFALIAAAVTVLLVVTAAVYACCRSASYADDQTEEWARNERWKDGVNR